MSELHLPLAPGTRVGELEVQRVLGTGAFSFIYLVKDRALGSEYALKEYFPKQGASRTADGSVHFNPGQSGDENANRLEPFRAEALVAASLDHPGVIRTLRYFEANNTAYLVMPWQPGQNLAEKLQATGRLDSEQTRQIALSLISALEYLHSRKLLHLDIKPSNIYLTDKGTAQLLDFGTAVAANGMATVQGSGMGSTGYAAPEQSETGGKLGPWSDIYSLAATLYRCMTGQIPPASEARSKAISAGQKDPLEPVSRSVDAAKYGGLIDLVSHGLELDLKDRPMRATAWRKAFESLDWRLRVAGGQPQSFESEGREWLPAILLAVFLVVMGSVAIYLFIDPEPKPGSVTTQAKAEAAESGNGQQVKQDDVPQPDIPAPETLRWQAALDADTVLGYRQFMEDFPGSVYREQAQLQLDVLDDRAWQALAVEDTRPAFAGYLEQFPTGRHAAEALVRIDEIDRALAQAERERRELQRQDEAAWSAARAARTIASLDEYIRQWPSGLHLDEAQKLRRQLQDAQNESTAFELASRLNTRESFQAYIDAFPQGAQVTLALEKIDGLSFRPGKIFRDCPDCPELIVVPAGAYWQGSEENNAFSVAVERPRRLVTIAEQFAVGRFEINLQQWDACADAGGCDLRPTDNGWGRGTRPVIMVSWNDAQQYIEWLNEKTGQQYRLPSESEWEYFARAGESGDWLGGEPALVCEYANIAGSETGFRWQHEACADPRNLGTLPAGSLKANVFGLYDVIGNVAEWTSDCMNLSYLDAPVDGSAWGRGICSSHMTRGGSWVTGSVGIRLPARFDLRNGDRNDFTGFRLVRAVE